jgi:chemotaxis family two-component system response regulator Rcp1
MGWQQLIFCTKKVGMCTRPDLIMLDRNLPKKSGLEVLAEINSAPKLKIIPMVIMTTSAADEEMLESYALSAWCYLTKPVDFSQVAKLVKWIEDLWLAVVTVPTNGYRATYTRLVSRQKF